MTTTNPDHEFNVARLDALRTVLAFAPANTPERILQDAIERQTAINLELNQ